MFHMLSTILLLDKYKQLKNMDKKFDNNLFMVTNEERNYKHWFTSLNRIAKMIGVPRTSVEIPFMKNKPYNGYKIEIVDGSDVMYRDIN